MKNIFLVNWKSRYVTKFHISDTLAQPFQEGLSALLRRLSVASGALLLAAVGEASGHAPVCGRAAAALRPLLLTAAA